ncbi:hypothetical protein TrST_g7031 [Triparma strigata]|uniref:Uncharacterized protein n=1 Tax=Triparma strigata TaxID=1606541 RepID=A0A9W7AQB0_9STRA|nr:hypothetical protein TrST_g7031 [Triparma strigata]
MATVDWASSAAKAVVADCIAKKRGAMGENGKGYNESLVEIYAEGAVALGCGIRELAKKVVEFEGEEGGGEGSGGGGGGGGGVEALLASAGTLTPIGSSPSVGASGVGAGADDQLAILGKKLDKILEENSSIIVDIRSNILKCNLSENYDLMTKFFVNCKEIVGVLDGIGGAKAPDFVLRIDLLSADGKKGVELGGGEEGATSGTKTT